MIELKLNTGEDVLLMPNRKDDNTFELVDKDGIVRLCLALDDNNFTYTDKGEIIESDETLHEKLDILVRQLIEQNYTGIESDSSEDSVDPEHDPFNPEEISIDTKIVAMETLLRRLEQGTIHLSPDFQRKEVWSDERKSQLIESMILKIPIPMFYVSSDEKSNWTVVDGLQRLSTIRDFVLGKEYLSNPQKEKNKRGEGLKLKGLEFWKDLAGSNLNNLPTHLYNRVLETVFTFTIINPGTPEEVKRNIFKRLNTGGMPLSSQEIRNALYIGTATKLLNNLAKVKEFSIATGGSIKAQRMEDKELILRFIAFIIRKYTTYRKTINIDTWLSDTMIILNSIPKLDSREFLRNVKQGSIAKDEITILSEDEILQLFILAMTRGKKLFGDHAFRKSYHGLKRAPINKSLFETWGVILSELTEEDFATLLTSKKLFMDEYKEILAEPLFVIAISRDSMKHQAVKYRFDKLLKLTYKYSL